MQLFLEPHQPLPLLARQLRDRYAGGARDDLCDVLGRHLGRPLARLSLAVELALARLHLVAQAPRAVVVLGRCRLVSLSSEAPQIVLERARVVVLRLHPQANARAGLVDQVDRLVGQEAVADVAIGELRGRDDRLVGDAVRGGTPRSGP